MRLQSDAPAERLLFDLGVTEPAEIDVEVIAYLCGVAVRYRRLSCGDARIVGINDRAIVTVDERASRVRQRFSVAHELGHWHHHRGQRLCCQEPMKSGGAAGTFEREADGYAADLLMPRFMLEPAMNGAPISLDLVTRIAATFEVSVVAAALRLADVHPGQFAIIIEEPGGERWFRRSVGLPRQLYVRLDASGLDLPQDESGIGVSRSRHVSAHQWFYGAGASALRVRHTARVGTNGQILNVVSVTALTSPGPALGVG